MTKNRLHLILSITALVILLAAIIALTLPATRRTLWPQAAAPILANPGFEGPFLPAGGVGELTVAEHWHPFYDNTAPNHRPEFQRESTTVGRGRVHTGDSAQKLFTTFSPHDGGIYQQVHQVSPGQWYTLSAWGYQWSSQQHDPDHSPDDGKCSLLVGINPWGDTNPLARTTVWGREALQVYNQWTQIGVTAQAWSDTIVVALRQVCVWGPTHNDAYLDDAQLQLASVGPPVTPAPTYTPYPTGTPCPSAGTCPSIDDIRRTIREQLDCTIIQLAGPICDP
jgi:hypothetical protein